MCWRATSGARQSLLCPHLFIGAALAERGVRFIQLCHRDGITTCNLPADIRNKPRPTDHASAALVLDLKRAGTRRHPCDLGGEFGRTAYSQARLRKTSSGAIIIRAASRSGWPAAASDRALPNRRDRRLFL